ncbi:TonB-dependent receptor [Alistipes sp.]|uniref:TonB-dependent receptor n=1 Tax=Alistipes sp. TaxID=1872444 RepID=UPI003AEF995C
MRKFLSCLLLWLFVPGCAAAQELDEYYPYAEPEEQLPVLTTDSALFYRAVQHAPDLYSVQTAFNLPQVPVRRRGQHFRDETALLWGLEVPYRTFAALRGLGAGERLYAGPVTESVSVQRRGGMREFRFTDDVPLQPYRASVRFADRNYLAGARFSADLETRGGWRLAATADVRTGRDLHVEGVFTNSLTAAFRAARRFGGKNRLALVAVLPFSVRGTRLSSTGEAFTLTGDRLYNPAWGYQNGKVRNSRVRRENTPFLAAAYERKLSSATTFTAALGAETGVRRYSALGWYDARTPMPDNYRYLPSFADDPETELAWRTDDTRFTQIDWDELIAQNRMAGGRAVYALEERSERLFDLGFDASFTTRLGPYLTLGYGFFCRREDSRCYKRMRDLLGADHTVDIDQYLVDDDTYGTLLQNDLRHPDRIIRRGDRFGYDYSLVRRQAGVRLDALWQADRLRAGVGISLRDAVVFRRGHYEKELFPGAQSYGRSRRLRFRPYTVAAHAGWAFSPRSYLQIAAMVGAAVPEAENLFFQPLYNNRTVDDPACERFLSAEAGYRRTGAVLDLEVTAFVTTTFDNVETRRYFDDMASVYCDMAVAGIGRIAYGIEAAADLRLAYRWRLSLAVSAGRYKYIRNPRVTVLSDVDNTVVDLRAESHMGGCTTGGAPQLTCCAGVNYYGPKGWGCRMSAGYAGSRYVEPMPLRRTARIAGQGGVTPEAFAAFTRQERLEDAATLDASLFKTFYFERSRLTLSLMLRNLTGGDPVYSGYEALRVRRVQSGDRTFREPHATRYTYAYPRSFFLTVSYRF